MRLPGRRFPVRLALAGCLALAAAPRESGAQLTASLSHGNTAVTNGGPDNGPAQVSLAPGADQVGVGLHGSSSGVVDLIDTLWSADFVYSSLITGAGLVEWGQASGDLSIDVSAQPEVVDPVPPNANGPLGNTGFAMADGILILQFVDTGTVTSATLAAGTPVTIEVSFLVDSTAAPPAAHPDPNVLNSIGAQFQATVSDQDSVATVYRLVNDDQLATASLDTAVGHTLQIDGKLNVYADAQAGHSGGLFLPEAVGQISAVGGLWLTPPASVDFAAASAHDYTVPVPEPRAPWLGAAATLALAGLRTLAAGRYRHR